MVYPDLFGTEEEEEELLFVIVVISNCILDFELV